MKKVQILLLLIFSTFLLTGCEGTEPLTDYDYIKAQQSTISLEGEVGAETLPTELNGVTVEWQSDIAGTIVDNKLVQGTENQAVELFATFTYNETVATKLYNITILVDPNYNPDLAKVTEIAATLSFDSLNVSTNLTLPLTLDGATIVWASNNATYITNDGTVTRPLEGENDALVTLTATLTYKDETITKTFDFTVLEAGQTYTGYYEGADMLTGDDLKAFLHNLIDDHTFVSYGDLRQALAETDQDPNNSNNIILLYTGASIPNTWDSGASWNREHVWPKSLGGMTEGEDEYSDMHHLRPANPSVNSSRGNKDFGEGGTLVNLTTDCYATSSTFEPRDEVKGDVARMIFYMAVRYEGDNGDADLEIVNDPGSTGTGSLTLATLSLLLQWHIDDPVDDFEMNRNDVIFSYQGNRNPFIDHPEFVELIFGSTTD